MNPSSKKGNNPERWEALLEVLDEKLQLGLLDQLKKISSYHFEADVLFLVPGDEENHEYLSNTTNLQHLEILAQEAVNIERVKLKVD